MIAEFSFLIWLLGLSVPVYWAMPAAWAAMRQVFLAVVSVVLLWALSPFILIAVTGFGVLVAVFALAVGAKADKRRLKMISWGLFLPLLLVEVIPVDLVISGLLGPRAVDVAGIRGFALLGLSYTAIRSFIITREIIDGNAPSPLQAVMSLVFFGSFVAGPITGSTPFRKPAARLEGQAALTGIARIGWGAAVFFVFRNAVAGADAVGWAGVAPDGTAAVWIITYQKFLTLYLDFTGYSEIAIGTALLFGIKLPENFRYPFLARSIQEFWQRWHLSLGAFIGTYLFKPLVRSYGKPTLAIFMAFVIVGLWHRLALPYFLWGIGHGAGLALNMYLKQRKAKQPRPVDPSPLAIRAVQNGAGWVFTMTYVAVLSSFALSPDIGSAVAYLLSLFGV
ncbi:MBOAT family O-acyltransferase [Actibacterium sp. 188UL27-1]|uniref:MBOAT family O-acyltransferase n=1 Tax=Actibacterium sp. 188UL27-1 TaxID=2786961 RepID=UPI00195E1F4C|nr:MBOAT family O-acyltransferase [Actibacterium sp. 188UL27-1]MBM7069033.1 hypothetical protein [Actibacterium sp. 188UL27-1]